VEQSYKDGYSKDNLLRTAHFYRASDFDYLINEVYAAHGYIFTKPKWQDYFKTQNWYKPEHKDVEDKITPLERANIDYLRQLQIEIQGNENSYTNPTFELQTGWSG
jgi:hypothetical protein